MVRNLIYRVTLPGTSSIRSFDPAEETVSHRSEGCPSRTQYESQSLNSLLEVILTCSTEIVIRTITAPSCHDIPVSQSHRPPFSQQ